MAPGSHSPYHKKNMFVLTVEASAVKQESEGEVIVDSSSYSICGSDHVMSMDYYIVTINNLTISDPATNDTRNKTTDRSPHPPEQGVTHHPRA